MGLTEIAVLLAAAIVAVPLAKRFGLGSVLGYLIAGVLVGPQVLGVLGNVETVRHMSEFGVVLLLFVIGLELKPARLWVMRRLVFGLGGAQVVLTAGLIGLIAWQMGLPPLAATVVGFGLALSSTAFVLPLLAERKALQKPHGQAAFSILLFQDLAVIPMLALLPALAGAATPATEGPGLLQSIGTVVAALAAVLVGGRYLIRPVLRTIANTGYQEVFTAAALFIVIASASLMSAVGLSMSLGAFLAGMLLADSEYRHELEADIEPFKGLFLGLFFMTVGMSANLHLLVEQPLAIIGAVVGLVLVKAAVLVPLGWRTHCHRAEARHLAIALAQAGEFGFVLYALGGQLGVLAPATVDFLTLTVTLSMAATPLLFALDQHVLDRLFASSAPVRPFDKIEGPASPVIIAGFGRVGQIVGRLMRAQRIPFTALEGSAAQVDFVRQFGNRIYYGDASRLDMLTAAGAREAKLLVVAIDDVEVSVRTVETARRHFPHLRIVARVRNRQHAIQLMSMGIDEVVRETLEGSLDLANRSLVAIGMPREQAERAIDIFRTHDQRMLRRQAELQGDEAQLIQSARESAAELEQLFAEDARSNGEAIERAA